MWHGFSIYPFTYNIQFSTFWIIQYVNSLFRYLLTFQVNDSKVTIDWDDFSSLLELVMQQPPIQLLQLTTCFYWNEKFDYALTNILKISWDSPLEYVVSLFNTFCNTNITLKKLEIVFNTYNFFWKTTQNYVCVNEILANLFTSIPLFKVLKNLKIQMEHSYLIVEPNVTQTKMRIFWLGILWQQYFWIIRGLSKFNL
jgi:hypothetical protein